MKDFSEMTSKEIDAWKEEHYMKGEPMHSYSFSAIATHAGRTKPTQFDGDHTTPEHREKALASMREELKRIGWTSLTEAKLFERRRNPQTTFWNE